LFITRSKNANTEFDEAEDILEIFSKSRESSPLVLDAMFIFVIDGWDIEFDSSDHRLESQEFVVRDWNEHFFIFQLISCLDGFFRIRVSKDEVYLEVFFKEEVFAPISCSRTNFLDNFGIARFTEGLDFNDWINSWARSRWDMVQEGENTQELWDVSSFWFLQWRPINFGIQEKTEDLRGGGVHLLWVQQGNQSHFGPQWQWIRFELWRVRAFDYSFWNRYLEDYSVY